MWVVVWVTMLKRSASAGYDTTGFDYSPDAIAWARKRFPHSKVNYETADLFDLPKNWREAFDLVSEIYILQALPPKLWVGQCRQSRV